VSIDRSGRLKVLLVGAIIFDLLDRVCGRSDIRSHSSISLEDIFGVVDPGVHGGLLSDGLDVRSGSLESTRDVGLRCTNSTNHVRMGIGWEAIESSLVASDLISHTIDHARLKSCQHRSPGVTQ
jgi:hypothetical protein